MTISRPRIVIMPSQFDALRSAIDAENRASMKRIHTWFERLAAGQHPLTGEPEPDPTDAFRADLKRFNTAVDEIIFGDDADTTESDAIFGELTPSEIRDRRIAASDKRDRAHARLTNAEKMVLAAARNIGINQIETNVEYQQALAAAAQADLEYASAEAADLAANPPSAEIANAEQQAIEAAQAVADARRVFLAELEMYPLAKAAHDAIEAAEQKAAAAVDALRDVVKQAAEADGELRGALGTTKAVSISRSVKFYVNDTLSAATILIGWARNDPERRAVANKLITIDGKALRDAKLELPAPIPTNKKESFTVSVTAGKLTK